MSVQPTRDNPPPPLSGEYELVPEIGPRSFEREVREGRHLVIVDTRDSEAFAVWRLDPGASALINIPETEFARDIDAAIGLIPRCAPLRVVCAAGNSSRRVASLLAAHGVGSFSVRGGMIAWSRVVQRDEIALSGPIGVVQFRREARGCLSYLVFAGDEGLVVDPGPDVEPYLAEARDRGITISRVFDTHIHADHLSGARRLADSAGAMLHLPEGALRRGLRPAERVSAVADGESLELGGELVRFVGLPGHTTDMMGLLLGNDALVAGDSLFVDSVARPDLEFADDRAAESARRLHQTLQGIIGRLAAATVLLPAHYGGGRVDGPVVATLGSIRRQVGLLALGEDEFVAQLLAAMPDRPANYVQIIAVNCGEEIADEEAARLEVGTNNCAAAIPTPRDRS
jgi:glyoxylase-like metal-dependent hydrolase (beta-lactamase superfamily II)/rhodanese-related sulfurtransferase